jgi:hypothetical protein
LDVAVLLMTHDTMPSVPLGRRRVSAPLTAASDPRAKWSVAARELVFVAHAVVAATSSKRSATASRHSWINCALAAAVRTESV